MTGETEIMIRLFYFTGVSDCFSELLELSAIYHGFKVFVANGQVTSASYSVLAEGRQPQDRHGLQAQRGTREAGEEDAAARSRPPVRRCRDRDGHRAGEDRVRPGGRTGRARPREIGGLHHEASVRPR